MQFIAFETTFLFKNFDKIILPRWFAKLISQLKIDLMILWFWHLALHAKQKYSNHAVFLYWFFVSSTPTNFKSEFFQPQKKETVIAWFYKVDIDKGLFEIDFYVQVTFQCLSFGYVNIWICNVRKIYIAPIIS